MWAPLNPFVHRNITTVKIENVLIHEIYILVHFIFNFVWSFFNKIDNRGENFGDSEEDLLDWEVLRRNE